MNETIEFEIWEDGVPVIVPESQLEFDVWKNDVPVIEMAESSTPIVIIRRRCCIF